MIVHPYEIPSGQLKMDPTNTSTNSTSSVDSTSSNKREKLASFSNWPQWAALTKAMLILKDVLDLASVGSRPIVNEGALWDHRRKEDRMAIGIATEIIQGGVSDDLFNNIMDKDDLKVLWEKLRAVCSQIGPGVVYSILQELLIYPKINRPTKFERPVISIFAEVRFLIKRLRAAVTLNKDIWDSIAIVIATEFPHEDFEHVMSGSLGQGGEKSIDEIESILLSAEAKFRSKRAVGVTANLAYMSRNIGQKCKTKATSEDECFDCRKMGHFGQDCKFSDYRLKKKSSSSTKQDRDNDSPRPKRWQANSTTNLEERDSDPEPFWPDKTLMTTESSTISRTRTTWYLDSCASQHLTNDQSLFVRKIQPKTWDFTTAGGKSFGRKG